MNKDHERLLIDGQEKIIWNPSYQIETIEEEGVFLFSEKDKIVLGGNSCSLLAPFLSEGKYSADELAKFLEDQIPISNLYYVLSELEKKGFIQAKVDRCPRDIAAFCGLLNISEKQAFERLRSAKVFINSYAGVYRAQEGFVNYGLCETKSNRSEAFRMRSPSLNGKGDEENRFGKVAASPNSQNQTERGIIDRDLVALLTSLHIEIVDSVDQAEFSIVVVKDYLQRELADFNHAASKKNHPWLLVKPYGSQIWIGPFFNPGKTGCYECLSFRLGRNRLEESYVQNKKGIKDFFLPAHAMLSCTQKLAWSLVVLEVFKYIVTGKSDVLDNKILTLDTVDLRQQEHTVTRRVHCTCCGSGSKDSHKELAPLLLTPKKKGDFTAGGYRSLSPEETLKKYSSQISPITGVVQFVERASNNPNIHVYFSGANRALPPIHQRKNIRSFRQSSSGKGTTEMEAQAGSLCESIERSSGEFQGNEKRIQASFLQIKMDAIHPHDVIHYSQRQYQERKITNPLAHHFHMVTAPFIEEALLDWTPIWSLTEQRYKYYPTTCCYYCYPEEGTPWNSMADSNGCAAGNCIEEAILQGFFELVERDSIAIWWYNRLQRPLLDLESFQIPYIAGLLKEYERIGREAWVLDITADLGIPVFAALSRLKKGEKEKIFLGFGAHLDPSIAIVRAFTEMNQFLECQPFWEENGSDERGIVQDWMNHATLENQPFLKGSQVKSAKDFVKWESDDLLKDIEHCRKIVESQGMEVLVLDQTRPEIGLNVVRVIVPGLRHFWPRFAPGRLYDVPVKMQWLKQAQKESELNPIGMFL
jgi:oxazoline/thiazoline synthase